MTKQILLSLLNCSWQWGLLGGLTWLITRRFRRANSTSHLLWLLFLLSLPILFALNQFVPALSINGTVPDLTEAQPVHISGLAAQTADLPAIASTESGTQSQGHTVTGSQFFLNWTATNLILCIWAIGTFTMLIRLAFGLFRIRRLRRTATVADDSYQAICKRLAQQLNIIRPITVCFSDRVVSPISFGWLSPSILIPRKLNLEQFELVAAHELAHVQRLDWLINLFSQVVGAIFFFHPIYHFLNRKLVHLRERICDDWVIQLTGARKNYAQCLLDLVRHENRAIPLALALNQPSQLESRIDSILKHNRRLDLKPKPRLLMLATFLLLTCLPLLSMAQLMPLRTVQLSLFAQTPQESEEAADDVDKKSDEQKKTAEMKDKKVYKEDNSVKVLDPEGFIKSQENRLFSGPQTGEKLLPLKVTGITGEFAGKPLDIIAETGRKPLVLFLQDTNAVGVKGLVGASKLLLTIDAFQKKHSNVNSAEKSDQGFQIGVVFLADDLDALPEWAHNMIQKEIPNEVLIGISPDGREGPGSYGLNRNVAQTILVAKDGKVLHNFAFTQPMLYADPHLLGAIAQVMEIEPATLEKWLNKEAMNAKYKGDKLDEKSIAAKFAEIQKAIKNGKISREEAAEWLEKLGITWKEGEQLLKKTKDDAQMMDRKRQYENRRQVEVADPTRFNTSEENKVFSGPQPGEKLPSLKATGIRGGAKDVTFDFIAKADGRPHVLLLQDESGVGLRGLYDVVGVVNKISKKSDKDLHISVVFLSDDPAALKQITQHVPENVLVGISPEGREGPGNYGLNRNVAQTILIAKDGKVLHNFAFTQPLLYADPHVIGAIAQTIGEDPSAVEKWLNEAPAEDKRMQGSKEEMGQKQVPSREELVKRFDKDGDGKLNREEGLAARRALANREAQDRSRNTRVEVKNPAEFKKGQGATLFSGPQPGEKLPPLKAKGINGETKDKTYDVIAKADGQLLVLFLQDESGLGLRGLVGISRLLVQIAGKSKQKMHIDVVFLGDTPDTLAKQASKIVPHVPSNVLLGISPDGREGPGSYGLNRSVAQTVIIAKDGKVLHNFAFTQPMLHPDPYVLGAVADAIGVKPPTLEKWLNPKIAIIEIKNPAKSEKTGKMLLNGNVVQFDELLTLLLNLPEEQKSMLIVQEAGLDVLYEQIVKVMNIAKKAGIDKIDFALSASERAYGKR
jgi:beta-lactamase regulating signal transducer with metallopeptidase domain